MADYAPRVRRNCILLACNPGRRKRLRPSSELRVTRLQMQIGEPPMEAPHLIAEVRKEARFTAEMSVSTIESKDLEQEQLNRPHLLHRTSRNKGFIHQHRATVLSDRSKNRSPVEAMSLIGTLHAGDESLLPEDVL